MHTETRTVLCYGKVPTHGDFVRYNAAGDAVRDLDEWLQKGLYLARTRVQDDGSSVRTPTFRFVWPTRGLRALVGVLRPSRDQIGRKYPFIVATEVAIDDPGVSGVLQVPVQFAGFLDRAEQVVVAATDGLHDYRAIVQQVEAAGTDPEGAAGPGHDYDLFLKDTLFGTFVEQTWEHFEDSRKYLLFKNLLDVLLPLRDTPALRFSLGLSFPLSERLPDPSLAVGFWGDVCVRLIRARGALPTLVWSTGKLDEGWPSSLLFFLQHPPPAVYAGLLRLDEEDENICYLERMGRQHAAEAALSIPSKYAELIESELLSLQRFLDGL